MDDKIKAIIVDDEKNSREVLGNLLSKHHPEIIVVDEASNVEDAYNLCLSLKPQLLFLDIQMPRANGFNLLKKFEEAPFEVIFVTSFDQYAITAIKFNALDYLLKPVELIELKNAIDRAVKNIYTKINQQQQIENLLLSLEENIEDRKFAVHNGNHVRIIKGNDVVIIEAENRYSHLTLISGEKFTMTKTIKEFEIYFGEKSNFIRISKSLIINSSFIKEYSKGDPFMIKMKDKQVFEVSRRKKPEVLLKLKGEL